MKPNSKSGPAYTFTTTPASTSLVTPAAESETRSTFHFLVSLVASYYVHNDDIIITTIIIIIIIIIGLLYCRDRSPSSKQASEWKAEARAAKKEVNSYLE